MTLPDSFRTPLLHTYKATQTKGFSLQRCHFQMPRDVYLQKKRGLLYNRVGNRLGSEQRICACCSLEQKIEWRISHELHLSNNEIHETNIFKLCLLSKPLDAPWKFYLQVADIFCKSIAHCVYGTERDYSL